MVLLQGASGIAGTDELPAPSAPHAATIAGTIRDAAGQPVAGARIVGTLDHDANQDAPEREPWSAASTTSDQAGHFDLAWPDRLTRPGSASLWVWHPGGRLTRAALATGAGHRPLQVSLPPAAPAARASIQVVGPAGEPVDQARVTPLRWFEGDLTSASPRTCSIPQTVGDQVAQPTDADGRVTLDAMAALRISAVMVDHPSFGRQYAFWDETLGARHRQVWLRAVGRVAGVVQAADPASLVGASVHVRTTSGTQSVGLASAPVGADGHFEVVHVANGPIEVAVELRPEAREVAGPPARRSLSPGDTVAVELPLRRGVAVGGLVRERHSGHPIAHVRVKLSSSGSPTRDVWSDGSGRFSTVVAPGLLAMRVVAAPTPYLVPPPEPRPAALEVHDGPASFALPPIDLDGGLMVRGQVFDQDHHRVGRVVPVEARWTRRTGRAHDDVTVTGATGSDGQFELGPIPVGVDLVIQSLASGGRTGPPVHLAAARAGSPVDLVLPRTGGLLAPEGRVVDAAGRPVAGALVQLRAVDRGTALRGPKPGRRLVADGLDAVVTDEQGRYRGQATLEPNRSYLASAEAAGCEAGRTRPVAPHDTGDATLRFPDLVLDRHPGRSVLVGRIRGRDGKPIAGVAVRDMARHEATTDAGGWFRLDKATEDGPAFVFAAKAGYRFSGHALSAEEEGSGQLRALELVRQDESPDRRQDPADRDEVGPRLMVGMMIQAMIVNPFVERTLARRDLVHNSMILESLARLEPGRVVAWLDAGVIRDRRVADGLRRIAARHLAQHEFAAAIAALQGIDEVPVRVLAELEAVARSSQVDQARKRLVLDRVDREARSIADPAQRASTLGQVASGWLLLDEPDRARGCLDDAGAVADSLPRATAGAQAWCSLIGPLARLDPALAQVRLSRLVDPADLDRCRLRMALGWADRDPVAAATMFRRIRGEKLRVQATAELCYRMTPTGRQEAAGLVQAIAADHPSEAAYATGMMAASLAHSHRDAARDLLHEAFRRLETVGPGAAARATDSDLSPAVVAAALLPTVEAVDPASLREFFWRSVALHPAQLPPVPHLTAIHALLLARYDRDAAKHLFDPGRLNAALIAPADFGPLVLAAAQIAPEVACHWVLAHLEPARADQATPPDPDQAHLALVAALTASDADRWRQATHDFLHLWSPEIRVGPR